MKSIRALVTAFSLLAVTALSFAAESFAREAWLADLEQLKAALTTGYPNLEWQVARGMDLPAVEHRARERLNAAQDEAAARRALERFVGAFGDGHLQLSWSGFEGDSSPAGEQPLCARLGYASRRDTRAIAREMPGYRSLLVMGANIGAGLFESGGRKIGVLRIAGFSPDTFLCERAAHQLNVGALPSCGEQCTRNVEHRTEALLVESLAAAIREIVNAKPDVILVDVAGNGGGNDSAIAAARLLTAEPLRTPRMKFVRSPAHVQDLREDVAALRAEPPESDRRGRQYLAPAIARLEAAGREAGRRCDLSPLWQGKAVSCSNLIAVDYYAGGLIDEELPADLRGRPWAEMVSATAQYTYQPASWTGPLLILVDGNSGSATELFAAMLQDAGRALVLGSPTVGAGCGWTLPREIIQLGNSHGQLVMPDCARLRADGTNELDGIQPELLIGFRDFDTAAQRVKRFAAALPRALAHLP